MLHQFSLLNLSILIKNPVFWLALKNSVKCLSKFLFKDSYKIRIAGSQNCHLILFEHISSSFKKKNQRKGIFIAINYYYWSILKTILNNKKIPCIPPIYHNNNYITDFKEKAQIFNDFFAKQCTLVENTSKLPTNSFKRTNNLLSTISFTKDDIAKVIKNFHLNKAHGFDMISIGMLKICGDSILKALELIFKSCLENGKFPIEWKKANVIPVHKKKTKTNKQLIDSYRPILMLPVCGKILEQIICNKMFKFFSENELISHNQSGFKPGDLCINQLLCITHDIYQSLDNGLETRVIFLDISKAFDEV